MSLLLCLLSPMLVYVSSLGPALFPPVSSNLQCTLSEVVEADLALCGDWLGYLVLKVRDSCLLPSTRYLCAKPPYRALSADVTRFLCV